MQQCINWINLTSGCRVSHNYVTYMYVKHYEIFSNNRSLLAYSMVYKSILTESFAVILAEVVSS